MNTIKTYTYKEARKNVEIAYTEEIRKTIDDGHIITGVYHNTIYLDNIHLNKNDYTVEKMAAPEYKTRMLFGYEPLNHRGSLFVSIDDFKNIIEPLRELRSERKNGLNHDEYRIITLVPDSLINRIRKIDGFKKATKESTKILRYEKNLYISCGTKKVIEYYFNNWKECYEFDISYKDIYWFDAVYSRLKGESK